MTVSTRVSHNLARIGKELHASPLPGTERFCLVTPSQGPARLAMTQVTVHSAPSGQSFGRVSFRFCDPGSNQDNHYHESFDTAWFVVDHRNGLVQFGPAEGLRIRTRDHGIGCYILGQLMRLLTQANMRGQYQVENFYFTEDSVCHLPEEEIERNLARAESALGRAGFYVSPAGGKLVVGARRASDLRSSWNSEKIRFLNITQVSNVAGDWMAKGQANELALEQMHQAMAEEKEAARLRVELDTAREQELLTHIRELEASLQESQAALNTATEELQRSVVESEAEHGGDPIPSPTTPAARPGAYPERITVEPSAGLMKWLWAALTVAVAAVVVAGAGHFV